MTSLRDYRLLENGSRNNSCVGKFGGNYVDLATNPHNPLTFGGDERIRTSDQSFSPDAPLAGECLRPARPRLRIDAFTTPHSLTDSVKQRG